jgi:hypothetical protein
MLIIIHLPLLPNPLQKVPRIPGRNPLPAAHPPAHGPDQILEQNPLTDNLLVHNPEQCQFEAQLVRDIGRDHDSGGVLEVD